MPFPVENKKSVFTKPKDMRVGDGITITEDGHIFGYVADWNARLIGSGKKNTRPPRSRSGYTYANAFNYKTAEGEIVKTGVLAGAGGHHFNGSFKRCQDAYADVQNKIASVVYGEDKHGVWMSGAMCSHVDEATAQTVRSSGVSGHWERPAPGKALELLGSCLVNIPGFAQASPYVVAASATFTPSGGLVLAPVLDDGEDAKETGVEKLQKSFSILAPGNRITASAGLLLPVSGTLAALNTPTGDGRQVNSVVYDRLPLPLWYKNNQGGWGHDGAVIVGSLDTITENGTMLEFTGTIDEGLIGSEGAEAVAELGVMGVSMDGGPCDEGDVIYEYDEDGWPSLIIFENYNIAGATLTPGPAFTQTLGVAIGDEQNASAPLPTVGADVPTDDTATETADETIAASALSPGHLPMAERDATWDETTALANILELAGGDTVDFDIYQKAFLWVDDAAADDVASYKLPFADVIDGALTLIPEGVMAAAEALDGGSSGVADADVDAVKSNVTDLYAKMADEYDDDTIVTPWADDTEESVAASAASEITTIKLPIIWR